MAVFTPLSDSDIQHLLHLYPLPPLARAQGISAGIENTNYLLTLQDGRKLILTLFEGRVLEAEIPYFTGLMEHLARQCFPAPQPLQAKDGSVIQRVKDKPAIIVTFLEGAGANVITLTHMGELGTITAQLHRAAQGYGRVRPNSMSFAAWKALLQKISGRAEEICAGLAEEIAAELAALEHAWPVGLPEGVIHADLFPDNVFFDSLGHATGVIDFYFACNDLLAYELAICINAWSFDPAFCFDASRSRAFLERYQAVRPLSPQEKEALPILARAAALRFLLTRAHDWLFRPEGALVIPKDPMEYVAKLRFHRGVTHYREYGIS